MSAPRGRVNFARVQQEPFDRIIGISAGARAIRCFARKAATVDATVLIMGETGTGKGVLARAIHEASRRARHAFVAVNCAGIPDSLFEAELFGHVRGAFTGAVQSRRGLFEQAHQGTLFLDEVGDIPLALQAKLLTVLEDREVRRIGAERACTVDYRTIAATGVDLEDKVAAATFRADLFHRLKILFIRIPPLRERLDDLPLLAEFYSRLFHAKYQRVYQALPADTMQHLRCLPWFGNIRELAHSIESAVVECERGPLRPAHFRHAGLIAPRPHANGAAAGRYTFQGSRADELAAIQEALRKCGGNKTLAARTLGMSRNTLLNKLRSVREN